MLFLDELTLYRIDELEAGYRLGIRPDTARRLADALGCDPGEIVQVVEMDSGDQ